MISYLLPGDYQGWDAQDNVFLKDTRYVQTKASVLNADFAFDGKSDQPHRLRAGTMLGQLANSSVVPLKRSQVIADSSGTSFQVRESRFFKAGDTVTAGEAAGLTIVAVDYATDTITVGSPVTVRTGDRVFGDGDLRGSGNMVGFLAEWTDLRNRDGEWVSRPCVVVEWAKVDANRVWGDMAAVREAGAIV